MLQIVPRGPLERGPESSHGIIQRSEEIRMVQGVSAQQLLDHLNKVLAEQPAFQPEMRFLAAPPGAKGPSIWGLDTSTPYHDTSAYLDAEKIVREQYDFDPRRE